MLIMPRTRLSVASTPPGNSLRNGLLSYWSFNEGAGSTVHDISGNGNTGTWQGTLGNQWGAGKLQGGGNFNGTDNFVSTSTQFSNPISYSYSVWFKTTSASGRKIFGFESSQSGSLTNSSDRHLYISILNGSAIYGIYSVGYQILQSNPVNNNFWHHAVCEYKNSTISLFIDGNFISSLGSVTPANYSGWWRIGSYSLYQWPNGGNGFFPGQIDDVGLWNRALSPYEVSQLYNNGAGLPFSSFR